MSAAQRLIFELPSQSTAPGLPAVPSTKLIRPLSLLYMSCQMIPTSARESMTGMKKMLWYNHDPRRLKSSSTAISSPSGVAMNVRNRSQMTLCSMAGTNGG